MAFEGLVKVYDRQAALGVHPSTDRCGGRHQFSAPEAFILYGSDPFPRGSAA